MSTALAQLSTFVSDCSIVVGYRDVIKEVKCSSVATGLGSVWGNKGGVGVGLKLFSTKYVLVNSHFAAHQDMIDERNKDFNRIYKEMFTVQKSHAR